MKAPGPEEGRRWQQGRGVCHWSVCHRSVCFGGGGTVLDKECLLLFQVQPHTALHCQLAAAVRRRPQNLARKRAALLFWRALTAPLSWHSLGGRGGGAAE